MIALLPVLTWALIALSLTNTVLQLWLGLIVFLNAENRSWGMWLSSGGLLTGGVFFISHTAILGRGLTTFDASMNFWWYLGLLAALVLPFAWYIAILWYAGFWESDTSDLHRRHRRWLIVSIALTAVLAALLIVANPFPSYEQVIALSVSNTLSIAGVPVLIIAYAASALFNVGCSLDALRQPGPVRRIMGELARQRARPWMVAAGLMLLCVALAIAVVMLGVVKSAFEITSARTWVDRELVIAWLDLFISTCILLATVFLGQAITRYEVFTGKTLPRSRLARHWRNVLLLAVSYGFIMSAGLSLGIQPIYQLLVVALLLTGGYVWFSHNSYQDRERYIAHLRPFLLSQHLYDRLVAPISPGEVDVAPPFNALCRDVLGAKAAYLAALGPMAPMVGAPLVYPDTGATVAISEGDFRDASPDTMCIPVNPARYGRAGWAVPLWSERGIIGALLLGEKANGGLYTQEEIEIARASGERLIDMKASAELARRLMELQRQRLAEGYVVDNRTRRMLHDDILPHIHTTMLEAAAAKTSNDQVVHSLADVHHQIADLLHEMPVSAAPEIARDGLVGSLRRMVEKEWAGAFDAVSWEVEPGTERAFKALSALANEVLYYAVREALRNAARHGRGEEAKRPLCLKIEAGCADGVLQISVADDGVGLNTSDAQARQHGGNGLVLHSTMMAIIGGALTLDSGAGRGTIVRLTLPVG